MQSRLIIADAETLLADLLGAHLTKVLPGVQIDTARTIQGLERYVSAPYDLAIVDLVFADGHLIDWLNSRTKDRAHRRILVLTNCIREAVIHRLFQIGVRNVVDKAEQLPVIERAIHLALSGGSVVSKRVSDMRERMRNNSDCFTRKLTDREQEVLAGFGAGKTTKAVASTLGVSEATVLDHRKSAMRKLNLRGQVALVGYAIEKGFPDTGDHLVHRGKS